MSKDLKPGATPAPAKAVDRRRFLRDTAFISIAAGTLTSCGRSEALSRTPNKPVTAPVKPPTAAERAEEMDRMHEAGIKAFPAKTAGKGNQPMKPRLDGGVKVFELTATELQWEVAPGQMVAAMAYNGQPLIKPGTSSRTPKRTTGCMAWSPRSWCRSRRMQS